MRSLLSLLAVILNNANSNQLPGDQLLLRQSSHEPITGTSTHSQQESCRRLTKTTRCFRQEVHWELPATDWQGACKNNERYNMGGACKMHPSAYTYTYVHTEECTCSANAEYRCIHIYIYIYIYGFIHIHTYIYISADLGRRVGYL